MRKTLVQRNGGCIRQTATAPRTRIQHQVLNMLANFLLTQCSSLHGPMKQVRHPRMNMACDGKQNSATDRSRYMPCDVDTRLEVHIRALLQHCLKGS
jgi:hypothetical protein